MAGLTPRVRFEVYAVWNGLCFFQHEAINVLLEATELLQASISPWIGWKSFKSKCSTSDHIYSLLMTCLFTTFFNAHITSIILCIGIMKTWSLPTCKRLTILVSQPRFPGTFMTENLIKKIPIMCVVYVSTAGKTHVLGNILKQGWWRVGRVVPLRMLWSFCPLETCWKWSNISYLCFSVSPGRPCRPLTPSSFSVW